MPLHLGVKMAGLEFRTDANGFRKVPKRKLPYIDDGGTIVANSTFIPCHIEKKYRFDFDRGLSAEERAVAWAFEKMAEEHPRQIDLLAKLFDNCAQITWFLLNDAGQYKMAPDNRTLIFLTNGIA